MKDYSRTPFLQYLLPNCLESEKSRPKFNFSFCYHDRWALAFNSVAQRLHFKVFSVFEIGVVGRPLPRDRPGYQNG